MRFLFNTVFYKPAKGGGGPIHSVSALAEVLIDQGHSVTIAASDLDIPGRLAVEYGKDYDVEGVRVRYFRARPTLLQKTRLPMFARAGTFEFGPEFGAWLEADGPDFDVIHSHIAFTWSNRPCSLYARKRRLPYLYNQRGNLDPIRLKRGWLKKKLFIAWFEKPVMRRADTLIALTAREVESFRALGLKNRIELIPNGINVRSLQAQPASVSPQIERLLRTLQDEPVFLWMSRIHPVKGPDIFVDAFLQAAGNGRRIHGILAGPDEAGMVSAILEKVAQAGVADRFHWVGLLSGDDKLAVLQRADCFVLPTMAEGFSMVLLEALAARCAVLTTEGAFFPEIQSSGAGQIIPRTASAFAESITAFSAQGRAAMAEMGEKGAGLVEENYTWTAIAERYATLCAELIQNRDAVQCGCS